MGGEGLPHLIPQTVKLRLLGKSQQTQTRTQGLNPELCPPKLLLL